MKNKESLSDRVYRALAGAGVATAGAVLIVPALFGGKEDPWGKFVYDYQTLITGILALLAAQWTIRAMRAIDQRQATDQRRQTYLANRTAIRAVERFCNAVRGELKMLDILICDYFTFARDVMSSQTWTNNQKTVFLQSLRHVREVKARLEKVPPEARSLLNVRLEAAIELFVFSADLILTGIPEDASFFDPYDKSDHAPPYYTPDLGSLLAQHVGPTRSLKLALAEWETEVLNEVFA